MHALGIIVLAKVGSVKDILSAKYMNGELEAWKVLEKSSSGWKLKRKILPYGTHMRKIEQRSTSYGPQPGSNNFGSGYRCRNR